MNDFKLGEIRPDLKTLSCVKNFSPQAAYAAHSLPVKSADQGYFGVTIKKETSLRKTTNGSPHAFKQIWERTIEPRPQVGTIGQTRPNSYNINWKQWPPQIPEVSHGLKIPIALSPKIEQKLSQSGLWREVESGVEAKPLEEETIAYFQNTNGSLNTPQSQTFSAVPSSLIFLQSKIGEYYTVTVKVKNKGHHTRRIRVIPPKNKSFQALWGSDLNEKTIVSPGLSSRISVRFKPSNNKPVNDILIILIEGDGAIIIPMLSATASPPILETTEWDVGCSTVGNNRVKSFEIKNVGSDARFWILTEEEFRKEYLAVLREFERQNQKNPEKCLADGKVKYKLDQIYTRCFRLFPTCFHLQKNQKVCINVRYTPRDPNFHYEKLAILCDNGEVRWVAIRGQGLDPTSPRLLELQGKWTGPPCDLPTDINTDYVIDCGDMLAGELTTPSFKIINKSCLPLYFFWCVRPIQNLDGHSTTTQLEKNILQHHIEGSLMVEWEDYDSKINNNKSHTVSSAIKIIPAQGILHGNAELECTVIIECPPNLGYHAGVLSVFVEQVNDNSRSAIENLVAQLDENNANDTPIFYEDLIETMPDASKLHAHPHHHRYETPQTNAFGYVTHGVNHPSHPHHPHHPHHKSHLQDTFFDQDEDAGSPMLVMTRRRNTHTNDNAFQLTKLKMAGDTTDPLVTTETKEMPDAEEAIVEEPIPTDPIELYKMYMEHETHLEQLKKDRNVEELGEIEEMLNTTIKSENKATVLNDDDLYGSIDSPKIGSLLTDNNISQPGEYTTKKEFTEQTDEPARASLTTGPKMWLKDTSALMPVKEVEIWLRSIPMQSWFYPPFLTAKGMRGWTIERVVQFHNQSTHTIVLEMENLLHDICTLSLEPSSMVIKPQHRSTFRVKVNFQNSGKLIGKISGVLRLPFTTIPCSIPIDIDTTSDAVKVLTPLLSYGLLTFGTEKVKTLAISNAGKKKVKWTAKVGEAALVNQQMQLIGMHQSKILTGQLLRVWPEWGILEPDDITGVQVYLSPEIYGKLATSIEVNIDDNPNLTTYVNVCADVQSPCLYFENGFFGIPTLSYDKDMKYTSSVKIINPTGFYLAFSWQCPIGRQSKFCDVDFHPKQGFVPPKGNTLCQVVVTNYENLLLRNIFVPCCVEGMKEPLLLKVYTTNSSMN